MDVLFWGLVFVVSLVFLVKGADFLISTAEILGRWLKIPRFIIGVTIVSVGTSLPELISSIFAVLQNAQEIVAANVIGSNISNILLIVGVSALFAKELKVTKDLINIDLPLLAIATTIFLGTAIDGLITTGESILMILTYVSYVIYTIKDDQEKNNLDKEDKVKFKLKDGVLLLAGCVMLAFGANYLIESLVNLSQILNIAKDVIGITAVAVGTSLPELLVSIKAAIKGNSDVALGNIFGSNIFNAFVVIGIPGLISNLTLDTQTFLIGLPAMVAATLLFVISGISKRIHIWEGIFYLSLYILFIAKLFNWF